MENNTTIIAQCTPSGSGALALLRLSGEQAITIADNISKLPRRKKLCEQKTHTVHFGHVYNKTMQKTVDDVLFIILRAPKSFTGENTVEITCHNNPFIIQEIIDCACQAGAHLAGPGEFSQRAVMHNKIDLIQAEAINELIHAQTELALKKSRAQMHGSLSAWITQLEQELLKAITWCETSFEFLDTESDFSQELTESIKKLLDSIAQAKKSFSVQNHIKDGFTIAFIGSVNAGKSSLFNTLLGQQKAIVTDVAGTTRDCVQAGMYRNGNYWTLIDTAGIRQTNDIVEQYGVKKSYEQAALADIVLLVYDQTRIATPEEAKVYTDLEKLYPEKIVRVRTKQDLLSKKNTPNLEASSISVSGKTGQNCTMVLEKIEEKLQKLVAQCNAPFLLNKRHYATLTELEKHLQEIEPMLNEPIHYELVSYNLQQVLEHVSSLSGKTISENVVNAIFKNFCVGK